MIAAGLPPRGHSWGWTQTRRALRLALRLPFYLFGFRIVDPHRSLRLLRKDRSMMIVSNHAAFIDSIYFILAVATRLTVCGAKSRLFATGFRRALMALGNVIEVVDKEGFLRDCHNLLEAGETILVYPEMGRRSAGLGAFESWAAEAALASSVPILPCYLYGTTEGHKGSVRLLVGIEMEARQQSLDSQIVTAAMRAAIETLEASTR